MKNLKLILTTFILVILMSFKNVDEPKILVNFGTYGFDDIVLTLNENNTFHYKDFSNPNNKIDVNGTWEIKKKFIVLKNDNDEIRFHRKWKVDKKEPCLKSRIGMTFYRLCKLEISY